MIEILDINKKYKNHIVFENFNIQILTGKSNAIMGESGSGKTTLLRILIGLEDREKGKYLPGNLNISVVFQEERLLKDRTVFENINFVMAKDLSKAQMEKELEKVGLYNVLDKKIYELSGGMRRRVEIVRAVLKEADYYIFDEPFKALDELNHLKLIEYIKIKLKNKTLIFTTHNKKELVLLDANLIEI